MSERWAEAELDVAEGAKEKESLERYRHECTIRFFSFLVAGGACFALAYFLRKSEYSAILWTAVFLGFSLSGVAAVHQAAYRGRSTGWGALSVLGIWILSILPDMNLRRLDEIEERLTGKPSLQSLSAVASSANCIPFWGLYWAIRSYLEARRRQAEAPIGEIVSAAFFTLAAVGYLIYVFVRPHDIEFVYGKEAFVRLPPGWRDAKLANPKLNDSRIDVAVVSPEKKISLMVIPIPRPENGTLEGLEKEAVDFTDKSLGPTYIRTGPVARTVGTRKKLEYVYRGSAETDVDPTGVCLLTCWETSQKSWITYGWATQKHFDSHAAELRAATDSVWALERD